MKTWAGTLCAASRRSEMIVDGRWTWREDRISGDIEQRASRLEIRYAGGRMVAL